MEGRATVGGPAPSVRMVDFAGREFMLADYRGTPVVLNFWASWCPFCIAEMPDFEKVHASLGGRVTFLGINLKDDRAAATQLAQETKVTYRLAADPDGLVYTAFGGLGMPTTVFVAADGTVANLITGRMFESQLRAEIRRDFGILASG